MRVSNQLSFTGLFKFILVRMQWEILAKKWRFRQNVIWYRTPIHIQPLAVAAEAEMELTGTIKWILNENWCFLNDRNGLLFGQLKGYRAHFFVTTQLSRKLKPKTQGFWQS